MDKKCIKGKIREAGHEISSLSALGLYMDMRIYGYLSAVTLRFQARWELCWRFGWQSFRLPPNKAAVVNHPPTMNWEAGRKLQAGSAPDGWGLGWHGLLFLMSCAYTKAEHLELPCGPSIWPASHLPEPDAPKQLWAKQHESFIGERDVHPQTFSLTHTLSNLHSLPPCAHGRSNSDFH